MTDARYEKSKAAVHQAVCEVLVLDGLSGLTVDRLATVSHVSRSTIYRNWPDMPALACEVFDELMHRDSTALPTEPSAALGDYLADYARRLNDPTYLAVLIALIEGAARDTAFADVHRRAFSQTQSRAGDVIRRLQVAGLADASLDIQDCVEDMVAPFLYRRLVTQVRITPKQVSDLHAELLERWKA